MALSECPEKGALRDRTQNNPPSSDMLPPGSGNPFRMDPFGTGTHLRTLQTSRAVLRRYCQRLVRIHPCWSYDEPDRCGEG